MLFQCEETVQLGRMAHTGLAMACLRFPFPAEKIRRHTRRVSVSYSDRSIADGTGGFPPVIASALRC